MGRTGAYLARPRAKLGGTVAAGARGGPGHGRARGSRRRDCGENERHGRSPWKVPGERCVRVISRGGRPGVGIRRIRPRVSRMTRRYSRRRCRRSVVSGVRSFDCALLRFAAVNLGYPGFKNSFCSAGKKKPNHHFRNFLKLGTHRPPIGPNNLNGKSASRPVALGVDAGMEIGRPMASLERAFSASAVASDDTIE